MNGHQARVEEFKAELEALISKHWMTIAAPNPDLLEEVEDAIECGQPEELYPEAWCLVVSATKIAPPEDGSCPKWVGLKFSPNRQNPFATAAMLMDQGREILGW